MIKNKLYRVTAECGSTIAFFTVHEVDQATRSLKLVAHGATIRDLAKLGIDRGDVASLRFNESVDTYGLAVKSLEQRMIESEVAMIERAARTRSAFLADAPAGSSSLREAMLVEAILNLRVQFGEPERRPVCNIGTRERPSAALTSGMSIAVDAALKIAEGK